MFNLVLEASGAVGFFTLTLYKTQGLSGSHQRYSKSWGGPERNTSTFWKCGCLISLDEKIDSLPIRSLCTQSGVTAGMCSASLKGWKRRNCWPSFTKNEKPQKQTCSTLSQSNHDSDGLGPNIKTSQVLLGAYLMTALIGEKINQSYIA